MASFCCSRPTKLLITASALRGANANANAVRMSEGAITRTLIRNLAVQAAKSIRMR